MNCWLPIAVVLGTASAAANPEPTVEWASDAALQGAPPDSPHELLAANARSVFVNAGTLVELDAVTGQRRRTLRLSTCDPEVPVLDMALGLRTGIVHLEGTTRRESGWSDGKAPGCPEELVAIDLTSGRPIWHRRFASYSASARVVVDGDTAFVYDDFSLAALVLSTGRPRWRVAFAPGGAIVGDDAPVMDKDAGLMLTRAGLTVAEDGAARADGSYNLTTLRRTNGRRAWSVRLQTSSMTGFRKLMASDGVVGLAWVGGVEKGHKRVTHVTALDQATGMRLWSKSLPATDVSNVLAQSGLILLWAEDRSAHAQVVATRILALSARTGQELWSSTFDAVTEMATQGGQLLAWSANREGARPILVAVDLATGKPSWRWPTPESPKQQDWTTPWFGLLQVGRDIVIADHARIYRLRPPSDAQPTPVPARR